MRCLLAIALALGLAAPAWAAEREFGVSPAPAWAVAAPVDPEQKGEAPESGVTLLLDDEQVSVGDSAVEYYVHSRKRIRTAVGLTYNSLVKMEFDPSFQKLVIHSIRLERGGKVIDALVPDDVQVLDLESEHENLIYDGRKDANAFLKDVRVGDVIDVAYSLEGANPVFGGRFVDQWFLFEGEPVATFRRRVSFPSQRPLQWRKHDGAPSPELGSAPGGLTTWTWMVKDAKPPTERDEVARVEVSEFKSWNEVATWAAGLLKGNDVLDEDMSAQIAKWKASPESVRFHDAVAFVQDDVRYLGFENGVSGYKPHPPSSVFKNRFGDCKDKSFLLVTLLRAVGLKADLALVHWKPVEWTKDSLPTPLAFNHAIVRAEDRGSESWIDATQTTEAASRGNESYGLALLVDPGTQRLTAVNESLRLRVRTVASVAGFLVFLALVFFGAPNWKVLRGRLRRGFGRRVPWDERN